VKIHPSPEEFSRLAASYGLVPVAREIVSDLDTPLSIFARLGVDEENVFLFESLEGGEKWGRYSIIGYDPLLLFTSSGEEARISGILGDEVRRGNPMEILRDVLSEAGPVPELDGLRFFGGAVGYLGYDMVRFMEDLPPSANPGLPGFPDSAFMIPATVLVHDNLKQTLTIIRMVPVRGSGGGEELYRQALDHIDSVVAAIRGPVRESAVVCEPVPAHDFTSNMSEDEFRRMVERAKEYILAGDIFQVVLSQRFHAKTPVHPFHLYRALRHINPSPYLFYLKVGGVVQVGSSPEILVRLEDGVVEVRPIAGTRRRGRSREEDLALEKELLADEKERAEHLMLVDLGRNDVGRVCEYGSVSPGDLMVIERYSHVMHIVSSVTGRLAPGRDQFDVLAACFPAGTVSGAPKIRAMEIIDELEPERRGPYAGSVGYFGFSGNMDLCITIRTFVIRGDDLWIQAGAGIVADSDPALEYKETVNKAMGLRRAVELVEQGF